MLTAEFESRKASRPQGAPQFLFFVGLFTTETAGIADGIHIGSLINKTNERQPLSLSLSPLCGARE